uniref:Uncharacterized protein n=1 Tax=Rhizophora mucronata TaxID=61149 RepID=A0A2P2PE30_RHIMU
MSVYRNNILLKCNMLFRTAIANNNQ